MDRVRRILGVSTGEFGESCVFRYLSYCFRARGLSPDRVDELTAPTIVLRSVAAGVGLRLDDRPPGASGPDDVRGSVESELRRARHYLDTTRRRPLPAPRSRSTGSGRCRRFLRHAAGSERGSTTGVTWAATTTADGATVDPVDDGTSRGPKQRDRRHQRRERRERRGVWSDRSASPASTRREDRRLRVRRQVTRVVFLDRPSPVGPRGRSGTWPERTACGEPTARSSRVDSPVPPRGVRPTVHKSHGAIQTRHPGAGLANPPLGRTRCRVPSYREPSPEHGETARRRHRWSV